MVSRRMIELSWMLIVICAVASAAPVRGADYYVKTRGDDRRDGLSEVNAWKTVGKVYTACVRDNVIQSAYKDYVTFRDLVVDETAILETGYGVRIDGGKGVRLERCEAYRVGAAHFAFVGGDPSIPSVGDQLYAAYAMPNQTHIQCSAYFSHLSANVEWVDCNLYATEPLSVMGKPWSEWQAAGKDVHSVVGDPQFVDAVGGDYALEPGSPAIDAATGVPVTPKRDLSLNVRPQGKAADIGAFESSTGVQ